ncbi:MAG: hypothetical protein M3R49_01075 [Chloroflexota bacterium]|nr:hypothetical protein [Chloroflexota bacterium]
MGRLALLAVAALLAACVSDARPADLHCDQPTISLSAQLARDSLEPSALGACRGQQVSLTVTVGQDGVLHIHGYDKQSKEVRTGETATFQFLADQSGQFVIELHSAAHPNGLALGIFTVYER